MAKIKGALFRIAGSRRMLTMLLAAVALGSAGVAVIAYATSVLNRLEGSTVDARFSIRGTERPPNNFVIVKIDDVTLSDLNIQWPFPRRMQGRLLKRIDAQHPAAIVEDIDYSDRSSLGTADGDALALAIAATHHETVFSFVAANPNGHVRFVGYDNGTAFFKVAHSHPAAGLFPPDPDGITRMMSYYPLPHLRALAVVTAEVATHRKITRSQFDSSGKALIDFIGPGGTFPSVSYSTALRGKLPPHFFTGKVVIVGATDSSLHDIHATSTDSLMSGPEEQANAIYTAMRGFPLSYVPGWVNLALILLLGLAVPLISIRLGPVAATTAAIATGGAFVVAAQLAFDSGAVVSVVYPLMALILGGVGSLAVQLLTTAFEQVRVRDLFARFVPENVVDEVLKSADGLRLGGVQREGTVMFTDLRGFTSVAESLTPTRVIDVLNHYLSEMSDAILDHGGTLVAYMGDGIMAVFGAPLVQQDHADRALATAREMLTVRLPRFNEWLRAEGLSEGFKMGIGLNSGHVMSGHVGSERRVEYTAVGDTTNTASRIEAMTKGTPHQLLFSEATKEALSSAPADLVFFEDVEIRGRVETVKLWSIRDPVPAPAPEPLASA
ncbi:MAG: CHASE2 domain-containing protein [Solirubrobacteraceae bacterium]